MILSPTRESNVLLKQTIKTMYKFNHEEERLFNAIGMSEPDFDKLTDKFAKVSDELGGCGQVSKEVEIITDSNLTRDELALMMSMTMRGAREKVFESEMKIKMLTDLVKETFGKKEKISEEDN